MINKNGQIITKYELLNMEEVELNELFSSFNKEDIRELGLSLSAQEKADIINKLDPNLASELVCQMEDSEVKQVLDNMEFEDSVALINELEDEDRSTYLGENKEVMEKLNNLKSDFLLLHPKDVANKIDMMEDEERELFFNLFSAKELSDFFACLDEEDAAKYLQVLTDNKASDVLENMYPSDAADIINELDEEEKDAYLEKMDEETISEIETLSEYSEDVVGSIMNTSFISIDASMDVKDAMKIMVNEAPEVKLLNTLFVSENGRYLGTLDFRKLIVTKSPCKIKDITDINTKYCDVLDNIEYAINLIDDYDIYALPVLKEGTIKGIVTIDDGFEALQSEREEDYNQLAGLTGEREENEGILSKVKRRIPWLMTLIVLDLVVCLLISSFEDIINKLTVLVFFQPVVLGLSGNVGMQSLAVCVRSLSNSELSTKKKVFKHLFSELRNGFVLGVIISILSLIVSFVFLKITKLAYVDGIDKCLEVSLILALSICASLTFSCLFGCLMPIIFNKLHIDPSAASGPFITTLNDVIAITIYFTLAILMLGIL